MEYNVVYVIQIGPKNSRLLLQDSNQNYYSVKVPNGSLNIGDMCSNDDLCIEDASPNWVSRYERQTAYPRKKMMEHLIHYKQCILHDNENGNGIKHVFTDPRKNLIGGKGFDDELTDCIRKLNANGTLRNDFTHMTSSQAFTINFFTPLIAEKKLSMLGPFCHDAEFPFCAYEYVKDPAEETQFDFYVSGQNGIPTVSVEVKYSEDRFGDAIDDDNHLEKYSKIYGPLMSQTASVPENQYEFFEYYQLWRNILYATKNPGQHVCFLFPAFRKDLKGRVNYILTKCKEGIKPFIHVIYADCVVEELIALGGRLGDYYTEFKRKYLDIEG